MTVTVEDPVACIAAVAGMGYRLDIRPLPIAPADGWRPASQIASDELLGRIAAAAGTRARGVAATWQLEKHVWFLSASALAGLLTTGRRLPFDEAWVHDAPEGWVDGVAAPSDGWPHGDGPALAVALASHLEPLIEALARHRGRHALWRCASDRLAQAALWAADGSGPQAIDLVSQALAADTPLRAPGQFELVDGTLTRRRTGCCLSHRCPSGDICADCVLR